MAKIQSSAFGGGVREPVAVLTAEQSPGRSGGGSKARSGQERRPAASEGSRRFLWAWWPAAVSRPAARRGVRSQGASSGRSPPPLTGVVYLGRRFLSWLNEVQFQSSSQLRRQARAREPRLVLRFSHQPSRVAEIAIEETRRDRVK